MFDYLNHFIQHKHLVIRVRIICGCFICINPLPRNTHSKPLLITRKLNFTAQLARSPHSGKRARAHFPHQCTRCMVQLPFAGCLSVLFSGHHMDWFNLAEIGACRPGIWTSPTSRGMHMVRIYSCRLPLRNLCYNPSHTSKSTDKCEC